MATLREKRKQAREAGIEGYRAMTSKELDVALKSNGEVEAASEAPKVTKKSNKRKSVKTTDKAKKESSNGRKRLKTGDRKNKEGSGKHFIQKLKYTGFDEIWSPREGTNTDTIFRAIKKNKGDREAAFNDLSPHWNKPPLSLQTKQSGEKRTKDEALKYLAYLVSKTLWDFAVKTGQHEQSTNRTNSVAQPTKKKSKK